MHTILPGQSIDHWETIVYSSDVWNYYVADSEPPSDWRDENFDPNQWTNGIGGFGYGDNDDTTIIPSTISLYLRKKFDVVDKSKFLAGILHADYDDAFVAYLNGVEIARSNIGTVGNIPPYNQTSDTYQEAFLYRGLQPEAYVLNRQSIENILRNGENVLAIQVHNQALSSSDLSKVIRP